MKQRILLVATLLFLLVSYLPHGEVLSSNRLPEIECAYVPPPAESLAPSQSLVTEDASSVPESAPPPANPVLPPLSASLEAPVTEEARRFELPVSDQWSDDFNIEVLPGDRGKKEPQFDIPIVINAKVEQFIQYFQTNARSRFASWLARSEKYIPFMRSVLREHGLPEDLVYMALIESGFNPYAYSRSKASGPWQFIYFTGRRYGLKTNWWVDERRDPEKSTIAAAKYLKDLYDMFECWYLAAAGYNAGENKIAKAIQRYRTEDFWELTKYRFLKQETKDYVPQMIAAALIAKDPEKYGFTDIEYQEPLRYEKVEVPELTDLAHIARACEVSLDEIIDLNPELRWGVTPLQGSPYEIKVPFGTRELFLKNFEALQPLEKFSFKTHPVKKGESFPRIAKSYRVDLDAMLEINRLNSSSRVVPGTVLLIPIPRNRELKAPLVVQKKNDGKNQNGRGEETIYTIKKGDTLWSIANELGVNIGALSQWNSLHPDQKLVPGDKLKVRLAQTSLSHQSAPKPPKGKEIIYTVKEGDTLWGIAKRYDVTVSEIKAWNHLNGKDSIRPSDRLKLRVSETKSSTLN